LSESIIVGPGWTPMRTHQMGKNVGHGIGLAGVGVRDPVQIHGVWFMWPTLVGIVTNNLAIIDYMRARSHG